MREFCVAVVLVLAGPVTTAARSVPLPHQRLTGLPATIGRAFDPWQPVQPRVTSRVSQSPHPARRAFLIETIGGTAGSGAGFGLGVLLATIDDCSGDDLSCTLEQAGIALGLSAVGASAGAWLAGEIGHTQPSGWGAILGGLVGVPAGIGVVHLISEDLDWVRSNGVQAAAYALTQGIVTALLSRLGAALRD